MCFHFSITKEKAVIENHLKSDWPEDGWRPFYHVDGFAFPEIPVFSQQTEGKIQYHRWGLVPHWVRNMEEAKTLRTQTLNARSETIFEKPSFRSSILEQRCLIPATGFFEWMDFGGKKYPHFIFLKNHPLFCFGGISSSWVDKTTGECINSFSIITTEANPLMKRIHNIKMRMPLIIPESHYTSWLDPEMKKVDIQQFFSPYPEDEMDAYTIGKLISKKTSETDVPEVLEKVTYPELWAS